MELQKLMQEAVNRGCSVVTSLFAKRILLATEEGIAIATENDYIEFSFDELYNLRQEINIAISSAVERFRELTAKDKNDLARNLDISYGRLQEIIYTLDMETQEVRK